MSILKKPYEISIWTDDWNGSAFVEKRIMTIGSDTMEYQGRAIEPKLVRKTSGEISFSFKMYYQFIDNTTGESVHNPYVDYICNETKVKLKYGSEWFDLLVKAIAEDSTSRSYTYTLVDQHMTELSKNGFDITLDSTLMNNIGTADELAVKVLKDTEWHVEHEHIVQTQDEALIMLSLPSNLADYNIYQIDDSNTAQGLPVTLLTENTTPKKSELASALIYAYYSSCKKGTYRFQFMFQRSSITNNGTTNIVYDRFGKDSDRIITDRKCQYYIDKIEQWTSNSEGFDYPAGWNIPLHESNNSSSISVEYRGRKYVYLQEQTFHAGIGKYLPKYTYDRGSKTCLQYVQTNYVTPTLIQNLITNESFKGKSGWVSSKFCNSEYTSTEFSPIVSTISARQGILDDGTGRYYLASSIDDALNGVDIQTQTYQGLLKCEGLKNRVINGTYPVIINSGPFDLRKNVNGFTQGEEYVIHLEFYYVTWDEGAQRFIESPLPSGTHSGGQYPASLRIRLANFKVGSELNGCPVEYYSSNNINTESNIYTIFTAKGRTATAGGQNLASGIDVISSSDGEDGCLSFTQTVTASTTISKEDFLNNKFQLFIDFPTIPEDNENNSPIVLIKKLQFYKKFPKESGGGEYYTPDDAIDANNLTYQEEVRYFADTESNAQLTAQEITFLPISTMVEPKLASNAVKRSSINIKESNYFNAIQSIAEAFKCWPKFEVYHNPSTGEITNFPGESYAKRVYFKNYVGQPNYTGFKYGINSKEIKRSLDSKKIVSKLIVKTNNNEFAPNGFCTIAKAAANVVKDNVLYDFSYYVKTGLIKDPIGLQTDLYIANPAPNNVQTEDLTSYYQNPTGFYTKMAYINNQMSNISDRLDGQSIALEKERARINVAKAGYDSADEELIENIDNFYQLAGFEYNNLPNANLIDEEQASTEYIAGEGYCLRAYDWAEDPSISDLVSYFNDGNAPYKMRVGTTYSLRLTVTPSEDTAFLGFHTNRGYRGLGNCWVPVTPGEKQVIHLTFTTPEEAITYTSADHARIYIFQKTANREECTTAGTILHDIMVVRGRAPSRFAIEDGATMVQNSSSLQSYLSKITTLTQEKAAYKAEYESAEANIASYEDQFSSLSSQFDAWKDRKIDLNKAFYTRYARFIQEGTWIDESYTDSDLYYNDAMQVLYNSSSPKVSYTMNVLSLSSLPGYEHFDFKIGDQTFVEDTEFFGYDIDGNPCQEEVTVTEITENLDEPDKSAIKIQNYENQFEDLFQRITATVQSVQYSEGAYDRAAELANADTEYKLSFLSNVLNSADLEINDAGNTIEITNDGRGIIITNQDKGKQMHLIGSGIYLKSKDENGQERWKTGLTADGISASLITSGQVDTGIIHIMNGSEPTFRWDTHGITAYDFDNSVSNTYLSGINPYRGVRFDRFGIYGYEGINGETWKPTGINTGINSIEEHSTFALTWEGLKVAHSKTSGDEQYISSVLRIGDNAKVDPNDATLLKVQKYHKNGLVEDTLWITEDGDFRWGAGQSPVQVVYNTDGAIRPSNTLWSDFPPEKDAGKYNGWHQNKSLNDRYASYTYDSGYTWTTAILIEGQNGTSPYRLTLDNDQDIIAIAPNGQIVSTLPIEVNTMAFYGIEELTDNYSITCSPKAANIVYDCSELTASDLDNNKLYAGRQNGDWGYWYHNGTSWTNAGGNFISAISAGFPVHNNQTYYIENTDKLWGYNNGTWGYNGSSYPNHYNWYSYNNGTLTINKFIGDVDFTFKLIVNEEVKDEETFSLTSVTSDVDYNFFIAKTTINSTDTGGVIPIVVHKRSKDGVDSNITSSVDNLKVFKGTTEITNWANGLTYDADETEAITLTLKQGEIIWDVETIEFVHNGADGDSPYTISLDEDFMSVPCSSNGTISSGFTFDPITPTVYLGQTPVSWKASTASNLVNGNLKLTLSSVGITASWSSGKISLKDLAEDADRATVTIELTKHGSSTVLATATFEAVKQKQGTPGEPGQYVYMVCSPNEHKYGESNDIVVEIYKRIGSGAPFLDTETTYYGRYYKDNNHNTVYTWTPSKGKYTWINQFVKTLDTCVEFYLYADEKCKTLIDKETVVVVKDGTAAKKEDIFNLLDEASGTSDGIVKFTDSNGNIYCGLNLDAIKTGALSVGPQPTFTNTGVSNFNNNKFYANTVATSGPQTNVYIAGWTVTDTGITKNSIGTNTGFHMYSNNYGVAGTVGGYTVEGTTSSANPGWKLAVGSNFGVLNDGSIYASGGRIGHWNIGTIPSSIMGSSSFSNCLYSVASNNSTQTSHVVFMRPSTSQSDWAFGNIRINADGSKDEIFGLKHNGYFKAHNADIKGKINTDDITVASTIKIGDTTFSSSSAVQASDVLSAYTSTIADSLTGTWDYGYLSSGSPYWSLRASGKVSGRIVFAVDYGSATNWKITATIPFYVYDPNVAIEAGRPSQALTELTITQNVILPKNSKALDFTLDINGTWSDMEGLWYNPKWKLAIEESPRTTSTTVVPNATTVKGEDRFNLKGSIMPSSTNQYRIGDFNQNWKSITAGRLRTTEWGYTNGHSRHTEIGGNGIWFYDRYKPFQPGLEFNNTSDLGGITFDSSKIVLKGNWYINVNGKDYPLSKIANLS